ncbi:glycine betaine ABC transporter substrate-binding protein [uncultured Maricaulis sp.]|uniref:glycine betaine ABC transporter substrate-binding protein n=1 Tax=uncultured Maricaulis sp. TaxID=174710 RepID=UPI0030D94251|tara:strand:- start:9285 stop:10853 length:1569 start_codon:yes stop_codon:yes gene_type:complete
MSENFAERWAELPNLLSGHVLLSLAAIIVGMAISVPLGIYAASRPRLAGSVLNIAGVIQTIPGLALLALMVPLLGGMIGYWPAFLALMLYSILPILRNTIVGLQGVDAGVREAARGLGMTASQRLWRVELPLSLPVIVAGLRTSVVWVVGSATLATLVGASSLGNYIFAGLQTRNWLSVLFGCVFAAGLAIVFDQMIRLLELAARTRRRGLAGGVGVALALVVGLSVVPAMIPASSPAAVSATSESRASTGPATLAGQTIRIGAKAFTEQYILAALMQDVLEDAGATVERRDNLGSTIAFDALRSGEIDVYVDYTGTIWATVMQREHAAERHLMLAEMTAWLHQRDGILTLGRLGFENAYGFAMTRARAAELGVTSLADLGPLAGELTIGGDPEVFARSEWIGARDTYGLGAMQTRAMDSTFMYGAVRDGQVDLISAYTTDGRIAAYDLVLLDDPAHILPPYDAVILLSPRAAALPGLAEALGPLVGAIDGDAMRGANRRVDLDHQTPIQAAAWLADQIGDQ